MKKNNYWFSFVEIIISISLFIIIWIYAINSFGRNFDRQSLNNELNLLNVLINDLDNDIWQNITDYELIFKKNLNNYQNSENNLYSNPKINYNSWTISTNDTINQNLNLKIYFDEKIILDEIINSTWSLDYNFGDFWKYIIVWNIDDKKLNKISINNFSNFDAKKIIFLTEINDFNSNTYTWIIIKNNMWWKKEFSDLDWVLINTWIVLKFESNWMESILEMNK